MIYFALFCPYHDDGTMASQGFADLDQCREDALNHIPDVGHNLPIEYLDLYQINEHLQITLVEQWKCNSLTNEQWERIE